MLSPDDDRPAIRPPDGSLPAVTVRRAGPWLVPLVVLAALGAAGAVAVPALLGRAVDRLAAAAGDHDVGWSHAHGAVVATAAVVFLGVVVEAVSRLLTGLGVAEVTGGLRRRAARHVLGVGPASTRRIAEGDLVTRLVAGTASVGRVVAVVSGLATALVLPVGGIVALAVIDPRLAVTFLVGLLSISGTVRLYLRDARRAGVGYLRAQGLLAGRLVDALEGARTIAAARTTDREVQRVLGPLADLRRHGVAVWQAMARLACRGEPVVLLTQVAVLAVAGFGVSSGRLTAGELLAASRYAVMAAAVGGALDELAGLARARAAADRLQEVLDEPVVAYGDRPLPPGPGELELRGVTAGPCSAPVLDGLELTVPGGRTTALVGRSGAGKSLTAALAGRLCDPHRGEVRLDGVPLPELEQGALRRAVAYAFERPVLPGGTVAGAIGFGPAPPSPDRIRRAARAARADGFIRRLPGGYGAPLGDTPMSGGELQRIGLARAVVRDARLLILDDAGSSLDTATEAEIAAALTAGAAGRTRLIVTHRAATAARADLVAWLDGGRVRAIGPHRDLWADPAYRAIFRADPAPLSGSAPVPTPARSEPAAGTPSPDGPADAAARVR